MSARSRRSRPSRESLPVAGREHPARGSAVHEVRAHRGRALGFGATVSTVGAAAAQRQRLDRRRPSARRGASPRASAVGAGECWRSGSGTARACRARPARRRGWSGSRRRRRRTRGRRSRPARTATGRCTTPRPPRATVARGAPGLPNTTRRPWPVDGDDAQAAVEARADAPRCCAWRCVERRRRAREAREHAAREQRPAGAARPERQRGERRARRERPSAGPPGRRDARPRRASSPAAAACAARSRCRSRPGGAATRPPTRCAATIEPAEVPTKYSQRRRSKPVASSIPASTPIIHASPSTPPPPSTSTSGRESIARGGYSGRRPYVAARDGSSTDGVALAEAYAITYACMAYRRMCDRSTRSPPRHRRSGPRVRALREAMDLSLRDLAERSGVSAPMLSQVERGETEPDAAGRRRGSPPGSSCGSRSCCGSTRTAR